MAGKELIVDDDYCNKLSDYFVKQGENMEKLVNDYISILNEIKFMAITKGDVAKALKDYISYAEKLKKQFNNISKIADTHTDNFLKRIDEADQYLF